jgi:dethiobiotin synthetase
MKKSLFITGIDTGVGKTVVSAILVHTFQTDYWKPVQAGGLDHTDTVTVRELVKSPVSFFHPESYGLTEALSPHAAAMIDGKRISLRRISMPVSSRPIVVEGAGGVLVPLNEEELLIDLIAQLALPVIVVSKHYLGSINHTLLTLGALSYRDIEILGVIFIGEENKETERIIQSVGKVRTLARIPFVKKVDRDFINAQSIILKERLNEFVLR